MKIPRTKEKPKREDYKFYDQWAAAIRDWKKSKPKAGAVKSTRRRKGAKWITTTSVWNGSKWVPKGDSSLVPNRAGPKDGNTEANKKLKIKAKEKLKKKEKKVDVEDGEKNKNQTLSTKQAFNLKEGLIGPLNTNGKKEEVKSKPKPKPKKYIKAGNKFASTKSVKGKRAKLKSDRLKILQDRIKKKKKEKK